MKKRHKNLKFLLETEKYNSFFFSMLRFVEEKMNLIYVFREDTFSGVYTNFSSFVALEHKFG